MYTLSEVCKKVGVSRRALQGYAEIGLLNPTDKTEAGYWLYDSAAIDKLTVILILAEAGYKRNEIKSFFKTFEENPQSEITKLINIMEEKRKQIEGQILYLRVCNLVLQEEDNSLMFVNSDGMTLLSSEKTLISYYRDGIRNIVESLELMKEEDINLDLLEVSVLFIKLYSIGAKMIFEPDPKTIEQKMWQLYKGWVSLNESEEMETDIKEFKDVFCNLLDNDGVKKPFEQILGIESVKLMKETIIEFCDNYIETKETNI